MGFNFQLCYVYLITETTVLVCRYNISTADYEAWEDSKINGSLRRQNARVYNGDRNGNTANRQISNVSDIYTQFGMNFEEGARVSSHAWLMTKLMVQT